MSQTPQDTRIARLLLILQICGALIFTASFFLPAIGWKTAGPQDKPLAGWACAQFTLFAAWGIGNWLSLTHYLLLLSGWLNPIVVIYLALSLTRKFPTTRLVLVFAMALCLTAAWIFLYQGVNMKLLIGHYLWATGAILIALPEADRLFHRIHSS